MTQIFAGRPIPLGSFGSVMGITGLGLAWRAAAEAQHVPAEIGDWLIAPAPSCSYFCWWGTFPTAALAGAFECSALAAPTPFYRALATITLAVATIIVAACAAWTLRGWILTALEARAVEPTS